MSTEKKDRIQKAPRQKAQKVVLTPEQIAERELAAKLEAERLEKYEHFLETSSHRQLRGELRRTIKREYAGKPPQPQAGLTISLATVLLAVLDNTRTMEPRLRPDQKNPSAVKRMCPV